MTDPDTRFEKIRPGEHASKDGGSVVRPAWRVSHYRAVATEPAPLWEASTWGPYFDALFPPQEVSPWIAWKVASTGVGIARRLWDQGEQLRGEYEDVHGTDRALWPVQHPGRLNRAATEPAVCI